MKLFNPSWKHSTDELEKLYENSTCELGDIIGTTIQFVETSGNARESHLSGLIQVEEKDTEWTGGLPCYHILYGIEERLKESVDAEDFSWAFRVLDCEMS